MAYGLDSSTAVSGPRLGVLCVALVPTGAPSLGVVRTLEEGSISGYGRFTYRDDPGDAQADRARHMGLR